MIVYRYPLHSFMCKFDVAQPAMFIYFHIIPY